MNIQYKKHGKYPDSILVRNFRGRINVYEIINSWKILEENNRITGETKRVINNLTECDLTMNIEDFKVLMKYLKEHKRLK